MFDTLTHYLALLVFIVVLMFTSLTLHIFSGKAEVDDFAVLIVTESVHFQLIRSHIVWSGYNAPQMGTGENQSLSRDWKLYWSVLVY